MNHNPELYNVSLKVFLKNDIGEILALKIAPPSTIAGYYDFPGGRINQGEFDSDYETLIGRELQEEIGPSVQYQLDLRPVSFTRHSYYSERQKQDIKIFIIYFEAIYIGGQIELAPSHESFAWLDLENIALADYFKKGPLEGVKRYLELKKHAN